MPYKILTRTSVGQCVARIIFAGTIVMFPLRSRGQSEDASGPGFSSRAARPIEAVVRTPSICLARVMREMHLASRTIATWEPQLIRASIVADTIAWPIGVMDVARACVARFDTTSPDVSEMPAMIHIALLAGADDRAIVDANRWLATSANDTIRAERLVQVIQLFRASRPQSEVRRRTALAYQAALRKLRSVPAGPQLAAEEFLLERAFMSGDPIEAAAMADSLRQTVTTLPSLSDRDYFAASQTLLLAAYAHLANTIGQLPGTPIGTPAVTSLLQANLAQMRHDYNAVPSLKSASVIPLDALLGEIAPSRIPLRAEHWFNRPADAPILPRLGVPTLIATIDQNCGDECDALYAEYRALYAEFAPKGIDFILIARTRGYLEGTLRLSASAEVDSIRALVQDRLHLPGILGIEETQFVTLPDGRREPGPSRNGLADPVQGLTFQQLVTKSGAVITGGSTLWGAALGEPRGGIGLRRFIENQAFTAQHPSIQGSLPDGLVRP